MKKINLKSLFLACILVFTLAIPAFAVDNGAYSVATNTYYLNPDTGVTDDGGSKNAALGEGMCRSVIDPTALIEVEGDKLYLTLRICLMSNIQNFTLEVQGTPGDTDSYYKVAPELMLEDAANDSVDMRFEIPSMGCYIRGTAYIIPMVRDVCFYLNTDSTLTPYDGDDFIVTVQADQTTATPEEPVVEDVPQEDVTEDVLEEELLVEEEPVASPEPEETPIPEETPEETTTPESTPEPTTEPIEEVEELEELEEEPTEEVPQEEVEEQTNTFPFVLVVAVIVAGAVALVVYKKRK